MCIRDRRELGRDDQAVAVLAEHVPGVAEPGLLAEPLTRQSGLGVGGRAVRLVATPLAVEVDAFVAASAPRRLLTLVLVDGPQALEGGGGLEQGAIDGEVLTAE